MKGEIFDAINFISKLSLHKCTNFVRVKMSYVYSSVTKSNRIWGIPVSISVEPTNVCNLSCPQCPTGNKSLKRAKGEFNKSTYIKILDELHKKLMYLILYFQGESFMYKDIFELIQYASAKKVYTHISTNGHFLYPSMARKIIDSGLDRLIISVDGYDQATYKKYRVGGSFDKVIDGIKNMVNARKEMKSRKPFLVVQSLVFSHNENKMADFKKQMKKLGVDKVVFKTAQFYNFESGNEFLPMNQKYARYRETEPGKFQHNKKVGNKCWKMWHSNVVTVDGSVVPCCYDKDADFKLGNVGKKSMIDTWNSKEYSEFRKRILRDQESIEMCRNCNEGGRSYF